MKKAKKCCNCKHAGTTFRIAKMTHMHCENPDVHAELIAEKGMDNVSGWDTLVEFWMTCKYYER